MQTSSLAGQCGWRRRRSKAPCHEQDNLLVHSFRWLDPSMISLRSAAWVVVMKSKARTCNIRLLLRSCTYLHCANHKLKVVEDRSYSHHWDLNRWLAFVIAKLGALLRGEGWYGDSRADSKNPAQPLGIQSILSWTAYSLQDCSPRNDSGQDLHDKSGKEKDMMQS